MRNKKLLNSIIILTLLLISKNVFAEDDIIIPPPPTLTENVLIRNGDSVVYNGSIDLPEEGTIDITDNTGTIHQVNNRSVLGVLYTLDQTSDSFSLSNLQYYDSFSSFYIKCITPSGANELCDSWQYVVGATSPSTSVDSTLVTGGENITLYFGNPYRINLSSTSITTADSITATAQSYNYTDNTWSTRTSVNVGVTVPNPDDQWNPIVVATYPVNTNGEAILSFPKEGPYTIGISEDYYFPSYMVTVNPVSSGGGGGGGNTPPFSIPNAISFLNSKQNSNGSFGDMLYTDWVAIAVSSASSQAQDLKSKIFDYLKNNSYQSSSLTDNERHAMALMALGIDPYSGAGVDYIKKITNAFDGTQFGDTSLYNDDIFAMIVLAKAGYISNDDTVKKDVAYIISKQQTDGSWGSVDLTAAAIQALRNFSDLSGVSLSVTSAETYLVNSQNVDGGFGNSFSTSWAMQALSQNGSLNQQTIKADAYLALLQQTDGGVDVISNSIDSRIWSSAYAIPGSLHKSWSDILQSFSKQNTQPVFLNNTTVLETTPIIKKEEIVPEEEEKIPEVVIEKIKNKKIVIKEITKAPLIDVSSSLVASAADASFGDNIFSRIWNAILAPFIWLFVKLGF